MILGAYRPRVLSEGNPRYKMARTISGIMLVWQRQLCCAYTQHQAVAAAAAAHHSGLWQGTVAAVADNKAPLLLLRSSAAVVQTCLQLQLLSCAAVSPLML